VRLQVTSGAAADVVRIELAGELDLDTVGPVRDEVLAALARGRPTTVVIGMRQVSFVDSTAVGTLVGCQRAADAAGARLVLAEPSPFVLRVLWVSGLLGLFGLPAVPPGTVANSDVEIHSTGPRPRARS
jgi:anti-anti-sigma factor